MNHDYMKEIRHKIHSHPELSYREFETAKLVAEELEKMGYEVVRNVGQTGVVALLESGNPGPCVGLRADMDALPLQEKTGLPYASKIDGVMHACGHDGHTATLLGVAKTLIDRKSEIKGSIKLIFQPAEEGEAGARAMIEDGVLENPKVDHIFGYHNWPGVQLGSVAVKPGCQLAATASIHIKLNGKGGHAALPHLCNDMIAIGSSLVQNLHAMMGRVNKATDPAVLSITQFKAGKDSYNVLPDSVTLMGTLRTTSPESQPKITQRIQDEVGRIAELNEIEAKVELKDGYPATMNHAKETAYVLETARATLGAEQIQPFDAPSMGGEDFSFFLEKVPGCYFFLGNGEDSASLHNPKFDYNDELLKNAHDMMVALAMNAENLAKTP